MAIMERMMLGISLRDHNPNEGTRDRSAVRDIIKETERLSYDEQAT